MLAELYPYPNSDTKSWLYETRYKNRDSYYAEMGEKRSAIFRELVAIHRFDVIVAYTKAAWPSFERLFGVGEWEAFGAFKVGMLGKTRVVLTPAFSDRSFNTEEQLQAFADVTLNINKPRPQD